MLGLQDRSRWEFFAVFPVNSISKFHFSLSDRKIMRLFYKMGTIVAVASLSVAGVGAAYAGSFNHSTTGVQFNGTYSFLPRSSSQGAFNFKGTLDDTRNDGNAGKVQVRVHGYSYNTFYGPIDADKYMNENVWDGAMLETSYGWAKICRDRGSLMPDNCSSEKYYAR